MTKDRKVLYSAAHPNSLPFPLSGDIQHPAGIPGNFKVFNPFKCPVSVGTMKIVSNIKDSKVIENPDAKSGLRYCELWKVPEPHPPLVKESVLSPTYQLLSLPLPFFNVLLLRGVHAYVVFCIVDNNFI